MFYQWSVTASLNGNADPAINFAEGMSPSSVNDSARVLMAMLAKWRNDNNGTLLTTGTATAFVAAASQTFDTAADMDGVTFCIKPHVLSGAAPTLAVNGLTARAINATPGVAVGTGALLLGVPYLVTYIHASTQFILHGSLGAISLAALDIVGGTALTAPAIGDLFGVYDLSATANRKITFADYLKVINGLTEVTAPDVSADFAVIYSTANSDARKVKPANLATLPIAAGFKGLVIQNGATPATQIDIDAEAVTVEVPLSGAAFRLRNINLTIDAAGTGANGLDTGGLALNTWYASLVIYNPATATVAGLLTTAARWTAGTYTLPAGYTALARFGWHRTDGSANFFRTIQRGRRASYVVGTLPSNPRTLTSGTAGTYGATWSAAIPVGDFVPPTASIIHGHFAANNGGSINYEIAPNNSYGHTSDAAPAWGAAHGNDNVCEPFEILLESTNLYWTSSQAANYLKCDGWEDNL